MPLPKLDVPIYETKLHSSGKPIKYRSWTMKEEKLLLVAIESNSKEDMTAASKQIIANCVQGDIDIDSLPIFDVENLLLRLREKSVGDEVNLVLKIKSCQGTCKNSSRVTVDLGTVGIEDTPGHTNKIQLTDSIGIIMKYPTMALAGFDAVDNVEDGFRLIGKCIDKIYTAEGVTNSKDVSEEELSEFLDSLTHEQFQSIKDFFETMPKVKKKIKVVCPDCKKEEEIEIEGIHNFFA